VKVVVIDMMIKTLIENVSLSDDFKSEHGLSLYIEIQNKKILFDTGAGGLFLDNAEKLDVDIADINSLVISHGHYDHGGGLKKFLVENKKAEVFIHRLAFEKYYSREKNGQIKYIGLEEDLKQNRRFIFTSDRFFIYKGVQVFSNVAKKECLPFANRNLFKEQNGQKIQDTFAHEQNLIIEEDGKTILITGCAHNGIVNIIEHFKGIKKRYPDFIIGGFHLSGHLGVCEDSDYLEKLGKYLLATESVCYTGHCTGTEAYQQLKKAMKDKIQYISTGSQINI
jgi:7,8-dihydropterin-6-yl-methyl-4-(beta-D-ribofuranosyl)aminobenzene 5'-phosphate synthase